MDNNDITISSEPIFNSARRRNGRKDQNHPNTILSTNELPFTEADSQICESNQFKTLGELNPLEDAESQTGINNHGMSPFKLTSRHSMEELKFYDSN